MMPLYSFRLMQVFYLALLRLDAQVAFFTPLLLLDLALKLPYNYMDKTI